MQTNQVLLSENSVPNYIFCNEFTTLGDYIGSTFKLCFFAVCIINALLQKHVSFVFTFGINNVVSDRSVVNLSSW